MSITNVAAATSIKRTINGRRFVVLGGGLSGLSFLHYMRNFLKYSGKLASVESLTLLEANDYMGGSVKTHIHEDGAIHELGPRSIRVQGVRGQNTVTLLEELRLDNKCLTVKATDPASTNRYAYTDNQLFKLEFKLSKLFKKLPNSKASLAGALYHDLFKAQKMNLDNYPERDPSVYEFFSHRFGTEVAEAILDPLMRGVTAGDCRNLSASALFQDFVEKEQAYGSVIKGTFKPPVVKMTHDELFPNQVLDSKLLDKFQREKVISFNISSGLQTIPEHLSNSLLNTNNDNLLAIYNQTSVESIEFNDPRDFEKAPCTLTIRTLDNDLMTIDADHVVAALSSKDLARILPKSLPAHYTHNLPDSEKDNIFQEIRDIPHSPVGCVCIEYRDLDRKSKPVLNSFGLLTHSKAGSKLLGISFDSVAFPTMDSTNNSFRMTCMMGGSWYKEVFKTDNVDTISNSQMEQIALEEIEKILKIKQEPYRINPYLWKTGIAQYKPGHKVRLQNFRDRMNKLSIPLTVIGQSYDGIAVNDVIFSSRMMANEFVNSLQN